GMVECVFHIQELSPVATSNSTHAFFGSLDAMPHALNITSRLWAWLFARRASRSSPRLDSRLEELHLLVTMALTQAQMHTYATSPKIREAMVHEWSSFREKAEELSRPFPSLRPSLDRLYIALENLAVLGRQGCLPPETYGKVLFSEANVCHPAFCELSKLVEKTQNDILSYEVGV
ncbi:MAG: hypothetical protein WBG19_00270, partial [Thermoplasmata archaeon]